MNQHTITLSTEALAERGYVDGAEVVVIGVDQRGLSIGAPTRLRMTPSANPRMVWGENECLVGHERIRKASLYVPHYSHFTHKAPMGYMPRVYIWATLELRDEAVKWANAQMLLALKEVRAEAQRTLEKADRLLAVYEGGEHAGEKETPVQEG